MSYSKQTWSTGDTVTAAKLNHTEDGIAEAGGGSSGGGVYVVNLTQSSGTYTCDKTAAEIVEAAQTMPVVGINAIEANGGAVKMSVQFPCAVAALAGGNYQFLFSVIANGGDGLEVDSISMTTSSADAYPSGTLTQTPIPTT